MYDFEVKDVSCGHCVLTVTKAIQSRDPGAKVKVDLKSKRVAVESKAHEIDLRQALAEADYPAS